MESRVKSEDRELLRDLLTVERILTLSVLVDEAPYASLLPFVLSADQSALLVHASELARHSRGLSSEGPYGVVVHRPDHPEADPLQVPRVSVQGTVSRVERSGETYEADRAAYLARFPQSSQTFALGDFHLYRLDLEKGRLIGGFGRALNLTRRSFDEALA